MYKVPDILLVDDNEDALFLVRERLEESKFAGEIHEARDGVEALTFLRNNRKYWHAGEPLLVFLDIRMPNKDGFEVVHEMKGTAALKHIPVVMLTTSNREEDIVRSYSEGACSYIIKPTQIRMFTDVVAKFSSYWTDVSRIPAAGTKTQPNTF